LVHSAENTIGKCLMFNRAPVSLPTRWQTRAHHAQPTSAQPNAQPGAELSVIIPTRRLDDALRRRISHLLRLLPSAQVIVVEPDDGAGDDAPPDETAGIGYLPIRGVRGRGTQCNAGARRATERLLLFLHDDTALPAGAGVAISRAFEDPRVGACSFRLSFEHTHRPRTDRLLRFYGFWSRFDSVATTFGDQGIVIRRDLFDAIGGFPDWPLFEDVALARNARRRARFVKLRTAVTTSAERFAHNGPIRQQLLNGWLLLRFLLGASPADLSARYERSRPDTGPAAREQPIRPRRARDLPPTQPRDAAGAARPSKQRPKP
jgi:hypothetical protein